MKPQPRKVTGVDLMRVGCLLIVLGLAATFVSAVVILLIVVLIGGV